MSGGAARLRVAILGGGHDSADWLEALAGRGVETIQAADVLSLLDARVDLAVIFADPKEAETVAGQMARHSSAPPAALMVSSSDEEHPHGRVLRRLLDAKNEWERTFDAIVDPVALLDRDGTVRRANLQLAQALGRPIRDTVGLHYSELLGAPEAGAPDLIAASLTEGAPKTGETRFDHLAGTQQVTASPYRARDGSLEGLVVIIKDMKDLKEQRERLQQAARLADIGQLAAGIAHEINTPLASIALRAESLLKAAQAPELQAAEAFRNFPRYLKSIDEEIFRCKKIIGALLDFSRMRRPETRVTDLNSLAEKAAELVGHQSKLKQVTVSLQLEPGLPPILADDGQLRQALLALLMNALDATAPGGKVEIQTSRHDGVGGGVVLAVEDNGSGIPAENLDKIFSPFFSTKPVGQGTGLGLAICHGIVASHGGEIKVDSVVGKGTRVALLLPAVAPGRAAV